MLGDRWPRPAPFDPPLPPPPPPRLPLPLEAAPPPFPPAAPCCCCCWWACCWCAPGLLLSCWGLWLWKYRSGWLPLPAFRPFRLCEFVIASSSWSSPAVFIGLTFTSHTLTLVWFGSLSRSLALQPFTFLPIFRNAIYNIITCAHSRTKQHALVPFLFLLLYTSRCFGDLSSEAQLSLHAPASSHTHTLFLILALSIHGKRGEQKHSSSSCICRIVSPTRSHN